jgi:hypothetical protein
LKGCFYTAKTQSGHASSDLPAQIANQKSRLSGKRRRSVLPSVHLKQNAHDVADAQRRTDASHRDKENKHSGY